MNASGDPKKKIDARVLLSTLWIVVMINMLKADILSLNIPGSTEELVKTSTSIGLAIPLLMLVFGAIPMEIATFMVILSRMLKYGVNRMVNIIVGTFTIAYIWVGAAPYPHYTFIAVVETVCLLLIIWNAWKWTGSEE